jgi:hypothetical protein
MYAVHHRRYGSNRDDYVIIAQRLHTVQEAAQLRCVSGDLVVNEWNNEIVRDTSWLFEWEKKDPNCYAQRAIRDIHA